MTLSLRPFGCRVGQWTGTHKEMGEKGGTNGDRVGFLCWPGTRLLASSGTAGHEGRDAKQVQSALLPGDSGKESGTEQTNLDRYASQETTKTNQEKKLRLLTRPMSDVLSPKSPI